MCQSRALPALDLKGSLLNDTIEAGTLECHGDLKRVLHPSRKEFCLKIAGLHQRSNTASVYPPKRRAWTEEAVCAA